ncbi:MAG: MATE family efflux transporter [Lachnoclostridium sp.]|nr:MATE family efflux transporter [Lachnospira sp.]MCM1248968.1 MATE family efflux transporter [Lachnoclostridium sp.]MCM1535180.1 MATE family efflux transporter [Clostridium sp.]
MSNDTRTAIFEETPIPAAVAKLAIPTVLSSLVMILYSMADTYFVGMLNDPVQNAAVALSAPILLSFNAVNNLFGVGSSSMMSRALGTKEYDTVKKSSAFGFYCALGCGFLLSLVCTVFRPALLNILGADAVTKAATESYLIWSVTCGTVPSILNVVLAYMVRSEGASLHASLGTMSGCLLNIVLDPVFILPWGLNMGAAGAGLATFLSNCAACVYFFILLFCRKNSTYISLSPKDFALRKSVVMGVCGVGVPAAVQNLLNVTGMTILNNFTSAYGPDAVAAMGIAQKVNMVPMQISMGVSQGIMPLIGYNYSGGNRKRMKSALVFVLKIMLPVVVLATIGLYLSSDALIGFFIDTEEVIAYGSRFLQGFCLGLSFLFVDFLAVGVFQAIGFGKASFVFALLRKIAFEIPFLYLLNYFFPLYGLAYAQFCAEFLLSIAAVVMLIRIFKGKVKQ